MRKERIEARFSESERRLIEEYADKYGTTMAGFIRQAALDKIKNIIMGNFGQPGTNIGLNDFKKDQDKSSKVLDAIYKKIQGFEKTIDLIKPLVKETESVKNAEIVDSVLRKNGGQMRITDLMKESGLNGLLYDVLSIFPDKYKINQNNEVILNE